ncbi:MAG TPA: hypothetical protein VHV75_04200 [Solirubrobacteraceae bacterium]|jgi:multisubunit Na+/H+ antiporter MnhG subunit|nr:hypothetical protein [Solirubrobacteraceae bacterium]
MYLTLMLVLIAVFCVFAGIFSGGIFTIILVPVAAIAVVSAVAYLLMARAAGLEAARTPNPTKQPTGEEKPAPNAPGEVPATPEDYVDALRRAQ